MFCDKKMSRGRLRNPLQIKHVSTTRGQWTDVIFPCVSGLVYNVTPYMDYHPGGEEELMKAAGIDGTELFDQVGGN